jgi:hypothetical protein
MRFFDKFQAEVVRKSESLEMGLQRTDASPLLRSFMKGLAKIDYA